MRRDDFRKKKIAILGVGMEGVAVANFLVEVASKITLCDKLSKEELAERAEADADGSLKKILSDERFEQNFGESYMGNLTDYDYIFRSPGISYLNPKIQEAKVAGVEITSQLKLFFDLCPSKIIGVTGTKGKGTTSSLIELMMKKAKSSKLKAKSFGNVYLAGNIGKPAITLLDKLKPEDWVILELSSFQLQDLGKSPDIAVIVNMVADHLDYHEDEEEYFEAKTSIVKYQSKNDTVIANKDYPNAVRLAQLSKGNKLYFSAIAEVDSSIRNDAVFLGEDKICESSEINLVGRHNLENIAAAALAAHEAGTDIESIKSAAKEFKGLPHRLELVAEINGVKYYNDSFATNPEPTIAAIRSFSESVVLILGGSSKKADFSKLAEEIRKSSVKTIIIIGVEGTIIKKALETTGVAKEIVDGPDSIDDIVAVAESKAESGDIVLFSPACASFDMFKNYKDRGEKFKKAVNNTHRTNT